MTSLEVKSLFTNVHVGFTIDHILNNIFRNGVDCDGLELLEKTTIKAFCLNM